LVALAVVATKQIHRELQVQQTKVMLAELLQVVLLVMLVVEAVEQAL
jgi:hypothetical protein